MPLQDRHDPAPPPHSEQGAFLWILAAGLFIVLTVAVSAYLGRPDKPQYDPEIADAYDDLSIPEIRGHVETFTARPERLTGGPGAQAARDHILQHLQRIGVPDQNVQLLEFDVPGLHTDRAELRAGPLRVPLHPVWPNLARTSQTPPDGLEGPLVDVGRGSDADLQGKRVSGSIVVMDWDSGTEWLSIPEFGGKAVIFRANARANGNSALAKFLTVPADVPRFYVAEHDLPRLDAALRSGHNASLHCDMDWTPAKGYNILARLSGLDTPNTKDPNLRPIIYHAYYDSISVVPSLAPGAEQSVGAATLLELARFYKNLPKIPERPVYVLFTAGHGQSLRGMTSFTRRLHDGLEQGWSDEESGSLIARMGQPGLFVGLDISSGSERFGVFCMGHFRAQYEHTVRPKFSDLGLALDSYARQWRGDVLEEDQVDLSSIAIGLKQELTQFVDCINLTLGRGWWTYFPYQAPFESELATLTGFPGITLSTINDSRRWVDTPDDRPERIRYDFLEQQLSAVEGERIGLANISLALSFWKGPYVSSELESKRGRLRGRVVWLDQDEDYVPNRPLMQSAVFLKTLRGDKYLQGTRGQAMVLTGKDGAFDFDGLIDVTANAQFQSVQVEAYGLAKQSFIQANPEAYQELLKVRTKGGLSSHDVPRNGDIIYAIDMARPDDYPFTTGIIKEEQHLNLVAFPCKAITLFGLTEPQGFQGLRDLVLLDAATESPPFQYGQSATDTAWGNPSENCITVWADPTLRVRITVGFGFQEKRLILINNSLEQDNYKGTGFKLDELSNIPSMVLQGAEDMWNLDQWRIDQLEAQGINNPRVAGIHAQARDHIDEARLALENLDYMNHRLHAERGWALESKAYSELLNTTNNMIRGVLFYLALLIPFAYCLERLIFASGTIQQRIGWMTLIFLISFAVLAVVHPAFRFTLTPFLVLLAFLILALAVLVSLIVLGKFDGMMQERKEALVGQHESSADAGNVAVRAVDLGIANIRRRPQRGFLTGLTIVLVTFTLLSFTSLVPETSISRLRHPQGVPVYEGLLARDRQWNPLPGPMWESLRRSFGRTDKGSAADLQHKSVVSGRSWFFSDVSGNLSQIDLSPSPEHVASLDRATTTGHFTCKALMCMDYTEPAVITSLTQTLTAGRWFMDEDELGVILPEHIANLLGYTTHSLGADVLVFGERLPLLALFDSEAFNELIDIDGEQITPVDFAMQAFQEAQRTEEERIDTLKEYIHLSSDQIAIVPLKWGLNRRATIRSVAVRTAEDVSPLIEAEGYARRSNLTILASDGEDVTLYAALNTSRLSGLSKTIVPLFLGFILVLSTMMGSVHERAREIFVYNSVGLSPTNVASLFLAESSVYALLGAAMGYLLGQIVAKLLLSFGALSGIGLNYSAGSTVFVTLLTMAIVLISTVYPARQAQQAAIPESHRDLDNTEHDDEDGTDCVSIYLPFVATPGSVFAMQAYLHEYLQSLEGVSVGQLAVDDLQCEVEQAEGLARPVLKFRSWLAPFDLGISHDTEMRIIYRPDRDVHQYHLVARHNSGDQQNWRRLTPRFILTLRKQLLMWRILPPEAHQRYIDRALQVFGRSSIEIEAQTGEEIR